jgi:hypothetical protein
MGARNGFEVQPRRLEETQMAERSKYLDAKINAAAGLCEEPTHPLDRAPLAVAADRRQGAYHGYKLGEIKRRNDFQ